MVAIVEQRSAVYAPSCVSIHGCTSIVLVAPVGDQPVYYSNSHHFTSMLPMHYYPQVVENIGPASRPQLQ